MAGTRGRSSIYVKTEVLKGVFKHAWNDSSQERASQLQAWVRVDFYEPWLEILVDHKVHAEDFEVVRAPTRIKEMVAALDGVSCDATHLGEHLLLELELALAVVLVQVFLEIGVAQLVSFLVLAVLGTVFLHCVVGEVHQVVTAVLD